MREEMRMETEKKEDKKNPQQELKRLISAEYFEDQKNIQGELIKHEMLLRKWGAMVNGILNTEMSVNDGEKKDYHELVDRLYQFYIKYELRGPSLDDVGYDPKDIWLGIRTAYHARVYELQNGIELERDDLYNYK